MPIFSEKTSDRVLLGTSWVAIGVLLVVLRHPTDSVSITVWPPFTYFLFAALCCYTVKPSLGAFAMPRVVARILLEKGKPPTAKTLTVPFVGSGEDTLELDMLSKRMRLRFSELFKSARGGA